MFEDSKLLGEVKILKVKVISGRMPNTIRWDDLTGMPLPPAVWQDVCKGEEVKRDTDYLDSGSFD